MALAQTENGPQGRNADEAQRPPSERPGQAVRSRAEGAGPWAGVPPPSPLSCGTSGLPPRLSVPQFPRLENGVALTSVLSQECHGDQEVKCRHGPRTAAATATGYEQLLPPWLGWLSG